MSSTSRRRFIGVAGAGAAAAGVTVLSPSAAHASTSLRSATSADESVVAHVKDASSDEVSLLVGEREVVVHDRDLVVRLLNAAGR